MTLQYFLKNLNVFENMKKTPSKVAHNRINPFFPVLPSCPKQPKSQFMFHKNCSPRNLCIMTLTRYYVYYVLCTVLENE